MPGQEHRDHETTETPKPPEGFIKPEDKPPNTKNAESTGGKNSKESDGNLDRDMVFWTRAVGIFTALLVISSILQYCAMRAQQSVMQGQLLEALADNRPWIPVPTITIAGPLIFDKNETATINIAGTIKNVGHSPAINIAVSYDLEVITKNNWLNSIPDEQRLCNLARIVISSSNFSNRTLFPGDIFTASGAYFGDIGKERIKSIQYNAAAGGVHNVVFRITGCVDYTFGDDLIVHGQTGFTYNIYRLIDAAGHMSGFDPKEGAVVQPNQMLLVQDSYNSNFFQ